MSSLVRLPVVSRSAVYAALPPAPRDFEASPLADAKGRRYTYLRLSVTDRCDLACRYCMPPSGEEDHALRREILSFEEAARLVTVFAGAGIERVRFTGGEPLIRKDFVDLVSLVSRQTGLADLVLTSNATRLSELAQPLRQAGLAGVNVSLDTLDPVRFREITRGGELPRVLSGIHASLNAGLSVKLNAVALRGVNDGELGRLVDFAWDHGMTPRFIELMPLGEAANLPARMLMSTEEVIAELGDRVVSDGPSSASPLGAFVNGAPASGPARYLRAAHRDARRVGFISALSDDFCADCNRVRVTARGDIRACLASRQAVSLRDVMRSGADDRELAWAMHWALSGKEGGHRFLDDMADEHQRVGMSLIGG